MRRDPLANPEPLVRRVYAYVAYRTGPGPDAEDVTSDVFERALRYRSSYDPARGDPASWLIGIARRCIQDAAVRGSRAAFQSRDNVPDDLVAPGELAAESVERIALRQALGRLDERDRELIALRYGADLSARHIGALLELTTGAVEVALHRARGRLRQELEGGEVPGGLELDTPPAPSTTRPSP